MRQSNKSTLKSKQKSFKRPSGRMYIKYTGTKKNNDDKKVKMS